MVIPCVIHDRESDSERDPIVVEMTWAWIPKSELEARRQGKANEKSTESDSVESDIESHAEAKEEKVE